MKKVFLILLLFVFLASCSHRELVQPDNLLIGTVTYVIDGDTFIFQDKNGEEMKVRMIGIDTPESVHPDETKNTEEGKQASEYTKGRLEGKEIGLEFDIQKEDQYGRTLAYVWLDGKLFNKELLSEGYASLFTFPPNIKYVDYLVGK